MFANEVPVIFCPTGAVWRRSDSPHVPMQPAEILNDVKDAVGLGITAVHLHARDAEDAPTWDSKVYQKIIGMIRDSFPDLVINVSTTGRDWTEIEKRKEVLSLNGDSKPDVASLTLSSMNFQNSASVNPPQDIREIARAMKDRGIIPELEIFDLGMANFAHRLFVEDLFPPKVPANIFFGGMFTQQLNLLSAATAVSSLDDRILWNFAGLGRFSIPAIQLGLWAGGGCRIGLEDTIFMPGVNRTLATNAQLVELAHEQLSNLGLSRMSSSVYRDLFALETGKPRLLVAG